MALSTDALLFGIALIAFGTWLEVSGLGGWPFALPGVAIAAVAFLASTMGSVASASRSANQRPDEN